MSIGTILLIILIIFLLGGFSGRFGGYGHGFGHGGISVLNWARKRSRLRVGKRRFQLIMKCL